MSDTATSAAESTTDVVVVGMGPAGESVAGQLAEAGLDVVGIDRELVGGECPYWGCVPSKMMIRAAHLLEEARRIPGMAGKADVTPDWAPVAERIRAEATDNWDDTVAVERFEGKGGRFIRGHGRLVGPDTVQVGELRIRATTGIVLATGTSPAVPPIDGLADTPFWTNHEAIEAVDLPGSLIVLGGGAIGIELAQVFSRFGVDVTVVEAEDRLLPVEEPEVSEIVAEVFGAEGIDVRVGVRADSVGYERQRFTVRLSDGGVLEADRLLVATGRRLNVGDLGLEHVGLAGDVRAIPVDEHLRVASAERVWAVGDVTGEGAFTHVGMYQAAIATADVLGREHEPADYAALPRVTFADPEVGVVGLTEQDARDSELDVRTATQRVPHTARGWIHKAGNEGVIKLVADRSTGTLVGATVVGPNGGEVLGLLALAVHARVPVDRLRTMIYAYPTFHRGIEDAVNQLDMS
ncbi:MAG: NAD(P)/FAD-dependent oxidoreductase [Ilumatobacter sp.]|nr:NAD(P)/FAD-dependent oxidoreductase [Ilumatobacter sp.]